LHRSKGEAEAAAKTLEALLQQHSVRAIAIGNGTASRETDAFVREFLRERRLDNIFSVTVSESGASVYSASEVARQEFPDLDLTVRGAISIARRLQDPLSELVKVDPKSIGVGQYQHDVDQRQLQGSLESVIESCVNRVGVDLNTSSWTLLRYVAGVTERTALNIVNFRNENGSFRSRSQLRKVPGIGPKTVEKISIAVNNYFSSLDAAANAGGEEVPSPEGEVSTESEAATENAALAGDEGPEEGGAPTEDGGADSATGPDSAGQSGDVTGLEEEPEASSDSVEDLVETGQYYEAEVVEGIEDAPPADEAEVTTHERPAGENEDVPDEEKPGEQR